MTDYVISIQEPVGERLQKAAAGRGLSIEQYIASAAEWFMEDQDEYDHVWSADDVAAMREAEAQLARGEGIPHEQVMAEARARLRAR